MCIKELFLLSNSIGDALFIPLKVTSQDPLGKSRNQYICDWFLRFPLLKFPCVFISFSLLDH